MIYRAPFSRNMLAELDRMQREMQQALGIAPTIRGSVWGGFPAMNMTNTQDSVVVSLFVPGVLPEQLELHIDKGLLVVAGERPPELPDTSEHIALHMNERFSGRFRRTVMLPEDADEESADAVFRDGVLLVRLARRHNSPPREIAIQ